MFAALCFGLGLTLFILWAFRPGARTRAGGLSFTFVAVTNDPSGIILAKFKVVNSFSRPVQLGVNEVQVFQSNGWPNWIRNPGGSNWFSVGARSFLIVSVAAPTNQGTIWRVPLSYTEDQPIQEAVRDKAAALVGYAGSKVAGLPFQGIRRRPWSLMYSPELPCLSNQLAHDAIVRLSSEPDSASKPAPPVR